MRRPRLVCLAPIKEIAEVVHKHDALIIADVVTSLGGLELRMDEWELDVCYGASQKCLGAPPGLAPISFSPQPWRCTKTARPRCRVFIWISGR